MYVHTEIWGITVYFGIVYLSFVFFHVFQVFATDQMLVL